MKKENKERLISIIITIFIMSSLMVFFSLKKTNSNDISFEKKATCMNYEEDAKKQLLEAYSLATPYFFDIFYSSKTDSCVYTYGLVLSGEAPNDKGKFVIEDYFLKKILFSIDYDNSSTIDELNSYDKRMIFSEEKEIYKN